LAERRYGLEKINNSRQRADMTRDDTEGPRGSIMNNKKTVSLILAVLFLLPFATTQAELLPIESLFKQMDQNKDGYINRKEINKQSLLANQFDSVDKNKDGNLDNSEFEYFIAAADL